MDITDVRVFPVDEEKLKAFVSIIIDDCFVISDIKIISGTNGLFISMPSKKRKNGTFRDIAHPLNNETRRQIEDKVLARYRELVSGGDAAGTVEQRGSAHAEDGEAKPKGAQAEGGTETPPVDETPS
jgi:stage V sporulation protein G